MFSTFQSRPCNQRAAQHCECSKQVYWQLCVILSWTNRDEKCALWLQMPRTRTHDRPIIIALGSQKVAKDEEDKGRYPPFFQLWRKPKNEAVMTDTIWVETQLSPNYCHLSEHFYLLTGQCSKADDERRRRRTTTKRWFQRQKLRVKMQNGHLSLVKGQINSQGWHNESQFTTLALSQIRPLWPHSPFLLIFSWSSLGSKLLPLKLRLEQSIINFDELLWLSRAASRCL